MMQLVYISQSVRALTDSDLQQIVSKSRINNGIYDLTSLLIYSQGVFIHLLEGTDKAVKQTYGRIVKDSRHIECTLVSKERVVSRAFAEQGMVFVDLDKHPQMLRPNVNYLFSMSSSGREVEASIGQVISLIQYLKKNAAQYESF